MPHLKRLSLHIDIYNIKDLTILYQLQIDYLEITYNNRGDKIFTDYKFINQIHCLKKLILNFDIIFMSHLKHLYNTQITDLEISNSNIENLKFINYMPNLINLTLVDSSVDYGISDLANSNIKKLTLSLSYNIYKVIKYIHLMYNLIKIHFIFRIVDNPKFDEDYYKIRYNFLINNIMFNDINEINKIKLKNIYKNKNKLYIYYSVECVNIFKAYIKYLNKKRINKIKIDITFIH
jgi:hypothetical protein